MKRAAGFFLVCVLLLSASTLAQTTNASLSGTILDPAAAVVPRVRVVLENVRTGIVFTGETNEEGVYLFPTIQPGLYRLTVTAAGFRKHTVNDITVDVGARMNINVPLEVASGAESVEVTAEANSPLLIASPSVGGVISGRQVRELPLPDGDALGLVLTQPGVVGDNFAGSRISALNISRDGINVMDNRINSGVNSVVFSNVEAIGEVRVTTSPVDAELGRGSGQVQTVTKSGDNTFHGTAYDKFHNTVLNANNWFNNLLGLPRNALTYNIFGGNLGGPIIKDRTFFFVNYEGQRGTETDNVTSLVYTPEARTGFFRFFPGFQNGNANAAVPTVDLSGRPVSPNGVAVLQSVNLYGKDPARPGPDPSGIVQKLFGIMPLPNDFRAGDGLNTAGFTWRRNATTTSNSINSRFDHTLNDRHRLSFVYVRESAETKNGFMPQSFPDGPGGLAQVPAAFYALTFTSTFSPTLVNELHAGAQRGRVRLSAPWELPGGRNLMPTSNGIGYLPVFAMVTDPIPTENDPQGRITPLYQYGDTVHWFKGKHELKFGGELRFGSTNGFNSFGVTPRANFGAAFGADVGIDAFSIPGLGVNEGAAQGQLVDLTGSVGTVTQAFNASGGFKPKFVSGEPKQRTWRQREFSLFIQDDFKLKPNLTVNAGLRYEFYGVPYDASGRTAGVVGGSTGLFGISGSTWSDLYHPGTFNGNFTQIQLIGKGSPNPQTSLYANDWNNFAPVIGLSWSIPYFGKDKTILRAGYSVSHLRDALRLVDIVAGDQPGMRNEALVDDVVNLTQVKLPLTPTLQPLEIIPLEDRLQTVQAFDNNLRTPYVQNWNLTVQRVLPKDIILDVRYVGSKGTKLYRSVNINEANIFENGILEAFQTTQRGGNSALMDQLFLGFNLGLGVVNGSTVRGSASARQYATTRSYLANNQVGDFAEFLNLVSVFGERGAIPRFAGLPENWIVANPQFSGADYVSNFANSTYHSLQIKGEKRFSSGWTLDSNYTWSRSLGEDEGETQDLLNSYRNGRDRHIDKRLLDFHRTHVVRNSGLWEFPVGPGKRFLSGSQGILARAVENWQIGGIVNLFSGAPMGLSSTVSSFNQFIDNTATQVGALPGDTGTVKKTSNGVVYFDGLKQIPDPAIQGLTPSQLLNQRSSLKAVINSQGWLVAQNPTPGTLGSFSQTHLEGPGAFRLDVNLIRRIRYKESREIQIRADAVNVLNSPIFGNPDTDINSTTFGRIFAAGGSRVVVLTAKISF